MSGLPVEFLQKMRRLLGDEYVAFAASYQDVAQVGLRVNTLKISVADFSRISPFVLTPVGDYEVAGFRVAAEARPGSHAYHAAGLYYLQEPSAMAVAALVDPQPGEWVLDLAAAPGGKATHLIARMGDEGLLVANDVDRARVQDLGQNLERWGAQQVVVTHNAPEQIAAQFGAVFDRVLVDAPCSGEGMFRRQGGFAWSQEGVLACARRQVAILDTAVSLVRPGGLLVYATCTFSPEEDEGVIGRFLAQHADFSLQSPPQFANFAGGRPEWLPPEVWLPQADTLAQAVRLWPHQFAGEGHFVALLRRPGQATEERGERPLRAVRPGKAVLALWREFAAATLRVSWPEERLMVVGNGRFLTLLPSHTPDTAGLHLLRQGVLLGELRPQHFKPAHTLALALKPGQAQQTVNFSATDSAVHAYLTGHVLPHPGPTGWVLVTVDGYSLGWARRTQGQLKNHYPRGLRLMSVSP